MLVSASLTFEKYGGMTRWLLGWQILRNMARRSSSRNGGRPLQSSKMRMPSAHLSFGCTGAGTDILQT